MFSWSAGDENSHSVIKSKVISVKIDGTETDIVLNDYRWVGRRICCTDLEEVTSLSHFTILITHTLMW